MLKGYMQKHKLVFAKDKKQAVTAIVVMAVFILNAFIITAWWVNNNVPHVQAKLPVYSSKELPPPGINLPPALLHKTKKNL